MKIGRVRTALVLAQLACGVPDATLALIGNDSQSPLPFSGHLEPATRACLDANPKITPVPANNRRSAVR